MNKTQIIPRVLVAILERIGLQKKLVWSLESHPDTDIFSKRRKIYSICVDDGDDTGHETVLAYCIQVNRDQCFEQFFFTNGFNMDFQITNLKYFLTQRKIR